MVGSSSSEGSTVAHSSTCSPISCYTQQSSFNYVKSNWDNPTYKKDMKPRNSTHYVLSTLVPLLGYLYDQCSEFLESWMAYHEFKEFPDLIKYYTTTVNCTLLKEECTAMENCTLLRDIKILCTLPNHISWKILPTKFYTLNTTLLLW